MKENPKSAEQRRKALARFGFPRIPRIPRFNIFRISAFGFLSDFGFRISDLLLALCLFATSALAQPKSDLTPAPYSSSEGEARARKLLARLLAEKPDDRATNTAVFRIFDRDENQHDVPTAIAVVPTGTNWLNIYTVTGGSAAGTSLTIMHQEARPNEHFLRQPGGAHAAGAEASQPLSPPQIMSPFAGSDFWIVDLGLDFLHWPQQRVLRTQMRKSQNCDVLESTNPHPVPGGYAKVRSWIAINQPDEIVIVHAEAFDAQGKRLKIFDPKTIKKVNGVWQLEDVEIRNVQKGTRTVIEFNLK